VNGLLVISDAAGEFTDLGHEANLREHRLGGAGFGKLIVLNLSDFALWLLTSGIKF
jgi:hypothetical protein